MSQDRTGIMLGKSRLSAPDVFEEDRISDKVYYEIRRRLYLRIDNACANITDVNHTALRTKLENLYYIFNRLFPY